MAPRLACMLAALTLAAANVACAATAGPNDDQQIEHSASNLLVVLRESPGANKQAEGLEPFGKIATRLPNGRDIEFEPSWYQYLGDLHLRIVFDGGRQVQSALPQDLERLSLAPEQALTRAIGNLRARYGPPVALPWSGGLMQVGGDAPDLNSSYLLDRDFWNTQLREHPAGVVVAVPRRGGLVFAPADNETAVISLRFAAAALYAAGDRNRLSSALYLFKDGRWSVFQPPQKPFD
ncbi:hypothetical protein FN976_04480 [Caenimonas sedimenti]|uniref:Uncharacterized protein n=1 Tax=Caenimonas sedimenti TaxID=2596921 RepID=A0A562ZXD3_9BURK|nr:hypothetical protein [Caenimonas sedimenti]TWO72794.1 hypothetical protein FN976_04480 [Caenimonas sedimenti]